MSSLFGQAGAQPAASNPSPFGAPASNNNTSSALSLFGGKMDNNAQGGLGQNTSAAPTAPAATGTTSLFGGNASTSAGSLFGNNQAAASQPSNSLFGNAAPSQPSNSLFGGTAAAKPAASLFGTQPAASQPSNSLFGGQPAASQAPATTTNNASLFQNGVLNSEAADRQPPSDSNAPPPNPAYFDALIQRGRKRQTEEHNPAFGELPQLQLGLQDISRKVRNLGKGGPSSGLARGADARAHYLLSASGVNTNQALRDLEDFSNGGAAVVAATPVTAGFASGVKDTLAQKHQNDFQKLVESHIVRAQDDFNRMIDEKLHGVDWDAHRQRIYEHFGLKKPQVSENGANSGPSASAFGRTSRRLRGGASTIDQGFGISGLAKSVIGAGGLNGNRTSVFGDVAEKLPAEGMKPAPENRAQRLKQEKFIARVKDLNVARIGERVFPILQKFAEVEEEPSNEDTTMLVHAYKALVEITGENARVESATDPGAVRERQYADAYLDDIANSAPQSQIKKRIIDGSRTFMEKLFFAQLQQTVARNPREANVGGVPSAIAKVKGYVRVRASRKELGPDVEILQEVNGDYCWPVLFYTLRSGLYREALAYVEENAAAFRQIDRSFMRYLRAYVASEDHRLPSDMQTGINNEYSQRSRLAPEDTIDPYRMVCYRVVGRCELQKRSLNAISNDMMDWLWFQFSMAREYNRIDEFAHEAFGLDELRESFKEIGEKWFGPSSDVANAPTTFFFMQITAGLFEKAVADLYIHNYLSATHFAIALDFYGLLRVSDINNSNDLLTYTTRQQAQIAFGSMVGLYTRDFRTADATAAVDYLCLLCLNKDLPGDIGKRQRELCYQALTEVVLETREFAQLLGDVRDDGQRVNGAIDQRLRLIGLDNEREFLKYITLVAARSAEEQSRVPDAALLYHLGDDYDKVLQVTNEALSTALTTELDEQPVRLMPLKPRKTNEQSSQPSQRQERSSMSLTATDDPSELSRNMSNLYGNSQMYFSKIRSATRDSCSILLNLAEARAALQNHNWPRVIDKVTMSRVVPTEASGNISIIRASAASFSGLPPVVARTVGYVMLWTVIASAHNIERLRAAEFETGTQQAAIQTCVQTSKDVMVFAGLIRFKLPGRVWETLARVGGELGVF